MRPVVTARGLAAHDAQRALSPDAARALQRLLAEVFDGAAPVVDLGVGSGATARHLVAAGLRVVGVDVDAVVLAGLRRHVPGLPAVRGDLLHPPLRDGAAAGVHMSSVLHHTGDWQRALDEVVRVLAPGGCFAVDLGPGRPTAPPTPADQAHWLRVVDERVLALGGQGAPTGDLTDPRQVDDHLADRGFGAPRLLEIAHEVCRSLTELLTRRRDNPWAWPADADPAVLHEAVLITLDEAAASPYGDVDEVRAVPAVLRYQAHRRP